MEGYPETGEPRILNFSSPLQAQFMGWLRNRAVSNNASASYLKWLRYYLDFCSTLRLRSTWEVKLLYGCGLRLFGCLYLRVQCFNFDMNPFLFPLRGDEMENPSLP